MSWKKGVEDCIAKVRARKAYYECYRCDCGSARRMGTHLSGCKGEVMMTRPATFAALDEVLVSLAALLERGAASCVRCNGSGTIDRGPPAGDGPCPACRDCWGRPLCECGGRDWKCDYCSPEFR